MIRENPNCCFEVDKFMGKAADHYRAKCHLDYDSVLAFGKVQIENDRNKKTRLLQLFAEKYDEAYRKPVSKGGKRFRKEHLPECCCVVIDVKELTGRRERTIGTQHKKTMWSHRF